MIEKNVVNHIIRQYFNQENILVKHQIESFNNLIDEILPKIISNVFPINVSVNNNTIELGVENIKFERPIYTEKNGCTKVMTPSVARYKNYTYSLVVVVDINLKLTKENSTTINKLENIILCKIPIIVKSKYCVYKQDILNECKYDTGGYAIVNGNEKVLIAQEKVVPNVIHLYSASNNTKYKCIAEVKSLSPEYYGIVKTTTLKLLDKGIIYNNRIYIRFPRIKKDLPIGIIFRALGCLTDKEIIYHIIDNDNGEIDNIIIKLLKGTLSENNDIYTEEEAISYISKFINNDNSNYNESVKYEYTKNIVKKDLLPHLNTDLKKIHFIGLMVNNLIKLSLNLIEPTNRDSYINKRMEVAGVLMGNLIFQGLNKISKDIKLHISKNINKSITDNSNQLLNELNILKIIKPNYIENILKSALATGNWGLKNTINRQGVSQVLNRLTYMSTLSHLRRVSTPIDSSGKLIGPRKLQNTQWGYICPSETPEGHSIGVVKNLSVTCEITNEIEYDHILLYLKDSIIEIDEIDLFKLNKTKITKLFINGDFIGYVNEPDIFVKDFKEKRDNKCIHYHSSIHWDIHFNTIKIYTDKGRCTRPLLKNCSVNLDNYKDLSWKISY